MSVLTTLTCRYARIPVKVLASHFAAVGKLILKFIWGGKRQTITNSTLKEKNRVKIWHNPTWRLTFYFYLLLHSNPLWWKGHLYFVLILGGLVGFLGGSAVKNLSAMQEIQFQYLGQEDPLEKGMQLTQYSCLVGLHWTSQLHFFSISDCGMIWIIVEWFALEMNQDHSFIFDISFKEFLPTVVDIMVIFTHSSPF